ncbi:conserved hypothetical protein [Ricinus communis]|uniref:Uncharacterized protein n=1 Tax=Ricinus communis TaxID=3988 RepID=B9TME8_RICCO|nr:conserved hypothetical protein [Ricinus communis]
MTAPPPSPPCSAASSARRQAAIYTPKRRNVRCGKVFFPSSGRRRGPENGGKASPREGLKRPSVLPLPVAHSDHPHRFLPFHIHHGGGQGRDPQCLCQSEATVQYHHRVAQIHGMVLEKSGNDVGMAFVFGHQHQFHPLRLGLGRQGREFGHAGPAPCGPEMHHDHGPHRAQVDIVAAQGGKGGAVDGRAHMILVPIAELARGHGRKRQQREQKSQRKEISQGRAPHSTLLEWDRFRLNRSET